MSRGSLRQNQVVMPMNLLLPRQRPGVICPVNPSMCHSNDVEQELKEKHGC